MLLQTLFVLACPTLVLVSPLALAQAAQGNPTQASAATTPLDFAPLFRARRFAQIERLADSRLAQDANDSVALVAKSSAIVGAQNTDRLDEAVRLAERCIDANPTYSNCHEALGNALGTKAIVGGLTGALSYATKIRDAYKEAVKLNPNNLAARYSLLQYYSAAPGFLGGGKSRAQEWAAQTQASHPEAGKLMQAALAIGEKQWARSEQLAWSADIRGHDDLRGQLLSVLTTLGAVHVNESRFDDAERIFKELQKRFPEHEVGPYGLGRVMAGLGKHSQAIALFDQGLAIYANASGHYRKGQSLQALGDKARAIASLEAALTARPRLSKNQVTDVQERLAALKA